MSHGVTLFPVIYRNYTFTKRKSYVLYRGHILMHPHNHCAYVLLMLTEYNIFHNARMIYQAAYGLNNQLYDLVLVCRPLHSRHCEKIFYLRKEMKAKMRQPECHVQGTADLE